MGNQPTKPQNQAGEETKKDKKTATMKKKKPQPECRNAAAER